MTDELTTDGLVQDSWLSSILGYPAYDVADGAKGVNLSSAQGIKSFVTARVSAGDTIFLQQLLTEGFRLVDTVLTFGMRMPEPAVLPASVFVRAVTEQDQTAVVDLAAASFTNSRFCRDAGIGVARAAEIHRRWVGNFFLGRRGDRMLVAGEAAGPVAGFVLLVRKAEGVVIDLIAVNERSRRSGLGKALIVSVINGEKGVGTITVTTQAVNVPAVRLYESMGFRMTGARHILHFHGEDLSGKKGKNA